MKTTLVELCGARPRQFVIPQVVEELPTGWRDLVSDLVADLAGILGTSPDHRIRFVQPVEATVGLRLGHVLHPPTEPGHATSVVVGAVIGAARRRSLDTCDACGDAGVLRCRADGTHLVRCTRHAGDAPPVRDGRDSALPLPPSLRDAVTVVVGDVVRLSCKAFPAHLADLTDRDEVPPGWRVTCRDLLCDVAALMCGAPGTRFELRRVHAIGQELHWKFSFAGRIPRVVAMGIRTAFLRATDEARWRCLRCGSPSDASGIRTCGCGSLEAADAGRHPSGRANSRFPLPEGDGWIRASAVAQPGSGPPADDRDPFRIELYKREDVAAALGCETQDQEDPDLQSGGSGERTEHQARLRRILDRGEDARWRALVAPTPETIGAVAALSRLAPHLAEVVEHVVRHMRAARVIGMPLTLPPMLLLGPPGIGKTWVLSRIAEAVGVPHRIHALNLSTLSDGIGGSHPVWRNSAPGLLARTLLSEDRANPIILVDEFDKGEWQSGADPYRPFYTLFEPLQARSFIDEYLGFPMDASNVIWVASANELRPIPPPVRSRLTIFEVPMPEPEYLAAVVDSIYAEANSARLSFFRRRLHPGVRAALSGHPPRAIRMLVDEAMVRAASAGRRTLREQDIVARTEEHRSPFGFIHP